MLVLIILLNFFISIFNCWSVGRSWDESRSIGGYVRFLTWCGAIMGACGFIYCNFMIIGYLASTHADLLPLKYQLNDHYFQLLQEVGYAIVILPVLGSGLAITIDSITSAYRERSFSTIGTASYNTFAQIYNTYEAAKTLPSVLENIFSGFSGDSDSDNSSTQLMLICVCVIAAISVGLGILMAYLIIHTTSVNYARKILCEKTRKILCEKIGGTL